MAVVDKFLKGIFGNKADKDFKEALPVVNQVKESVPNPDCSF